MLPFSSEPNPSSSALATTNHRRSSPSDDSGDTRCLSGDDQQLDRPKKPSPFDLANAQFPHRDYSSEDDDDDESSIETAEDDDEGEELGMETLWSGNDWESSWSRKWRSGTSVPGGVTLEGYVEASPATVSGDAGSEDGSSVGRTKSLTDDDLEELKGCLDLGFGFSYDEIPELCNTLPALELCYSMSRSLELSGDGSGNSTVMEACLASSSASVPVANWKISSPGDDPEEVKARLKYWAQAVACTVKLCS